MRLNPPFFRRAVTLACASLGFAVAGCTSMAGAAASGTAYTMADFSRVAKFDSHVHANTADSALVDQARADGFEILSINVDYPDFPPLAEQARVARRFAAADRAHFHYATTFSMQGWGDAQWAERTNKAIDAAVADGAVAVKVWKNVGMGERDANGRLVMIDDGGLRPVWRRIEALGIPLIGHQGEPHNCWLPIQEMTTANDRAYFAAHPQYHMHLHPEMPSYEEQMAARDRMVAGNPKLRFVGAHMGSMEWNVELLSRFLDANPHATVDLAARMAQVQHQSVRDHDKVRTFFIRYQDRLLYATDLTQNPDADPMAIREAAHKVWLSDWRYLATDEAQRVDDIDASPRGLALPRSVIDKIYYGNARRVFFTRN